MRALTRMETLASLIILVALNGPDGQEILVNPEEIISMRDIRPKGKDLLAPGTKCAIQTVDGKAILVNDNCETVKAKLSK